MKKLLALLLSGMMVLSFTACGGDDVEDTGVDSDVQAEVEMYEISDISNTVWSFAGGMAEGVQFTEEEYNNAMAAFGGTMYIVLNDDNTAKMVQGGGTLQGKYMLTGEDNDQLGLSFDNKGSEVIYVCGLTTVEDIPVIIAYTDESFTNAVYFIYQMEF